MDPIADAVAAIETALKRINGRRKRRRLSFANLMEVEPPEGAFEVVREHSVDPPVRRGRRFLRRKSSRTSAALVFTWRTDRYCVLRAVPARSATGFSDLVWGDRWRRSVDLATDLPDASLWLPSLDDLAVHSDQLEESGLARIC